MIHSISFQVRHIFKIKKVEIYMTKLYYIINNLINMGIILFELNNKCTIIMMLINQSIMFISRLVKIVISILINIRD